MSLLHGFFFGTAILIGIYLGLSRADSVTSILGAGSKAYNTGVTTLQAR